MTKSNSLRKSEPLAAVDREDEPAAGANDRHVGPRENQREKVPAAERKPRRKTSGHCAHEEVPGVSHYVTRTGGDQLVIAVVT